MIIMTIIKVWLQRKSGRFEKNRAPMRDWSAKKRRSRVRMPSHHHHKRSILVCELRNKLSNPIHNESSNSDPREYFQSIRAAFNFNARTILFPENIIIDQTWYRRTPHYCFSKIYSGFLYEYVASRDVWRCFRSIYHTLCPIRTN